MSSGFQVVKTVFTSLQVPHHPTSVVGSHLRKASFTQGLKSPVITKATRLPHRYVLIGILSTFLYHNPAALIHEDLIPNPMLHRGVGPIGDSLDCTRRSTVLAGTGGGNFKLKAMRNIRLIRRRMMNGDERLFGMQK